MNFEPLKSAGGHHTPSVCPPTLSRSSLSTAPVPWASSAEPEVSDEEVIQVLQAGRFAPRIRTAQAAGAGAGPIDGFSRSHSPREAAHLLRLVEIARWFYVCG